MNLAKRPGAFRAAIALAAITLGLAVCAQAQTYTTLANFDGYNGGSPGYGSLFQAADGNYYGTTPYGGTHSRGVFFEVTPSGELTDIYDFCSLTQCTDGGRLGFRPCSALTEISTGSQTWVETASTQVRSTK